MIISSTCASLYLYYIYMSMPLMCVNQYLDHIHMILLITSVGQCLECHNYTISRYIINNLMQCYKKKLMHCTTQVHIYKSFNIILYICTNTILLLWYLDNKFDTYVIPIWYLKNFKCLYLCSFMEFQYFAQMFYILKLLNMTTLLDII